MTGAEAVVNLFLARLHPFVPLEELAQAARVPRAELVAEVERQRECRRRARIVAVDSRRAGTHRKKRAV